METPPTAAGENHPLLTVVHTDTVRIFVDVPEADATYVDPGDEAIIRVQALGDVPVRGHVRQRPPPYVPIEDTS